jgi:S1-C subfamily serine protease
MQRTKPNLGVLMVPASEQFAKAFALSRPAGAMISEVARGSSAAEAGLRRGDLVLLFGRSTIQDVDDFEDKIRAAAPGTNIKLTVWRLNEKGVETFTTEIVTPAGNNAELQFHRLKQKIDEQNKEAKRIIDSINR